MNKFLHLIFTTLFAAALTGCGGNAGSSPADSNNNLVKEAGLLSIDDFDGYSEVVIRNPWDSTRALARYVLVDSGATLPENIDFSSYQRINVPLNKSIVYSNVHGSLIHELGKTDAIAGVADAQYITDTLLANLIKRGFIADCGNSTSPNIERIMQIKPDAILLSPMGENISHGKLDALNIPLVETADYLEKTPLGRAEWMKFYGRLYGRGKLADSIFNDIQHQYNALKTSVSSTDSRPKVIIDGVYGQNWNVPTSGSVTGHLIEDAGGSNPFANYNNAGSASLSPEEVIFKGADADIWLVRYFRDNDMTLSDWGIENKNYSRFKAYKTGNVFGSNTKRSGVFDDGAFHPHWILAEMISILHPELSSIPKHKHYYGKLK